jgi:hypothetical protein
MPGPRLQPAPCAALKANHTSLKKWALLLPFAEAPAAVRIKKHAFAHPLTVVHLNKHMQDEMVVH